MIKILHISYSTNKNCINPESFGVICVKCNGCGKIDETTKYQSQLKIYERQLEERYNFDRWADEEDLRKIQEKNIKSDIKYLKQKIEEIKKKIEE